MSVRARMKVGSVTPHGENLVSVSLYAVYSSDPSDPNYSYSQATPAASFSLSITNPDAFNQFEVGDVFDLTFEKLKPS